MRYGEECSFDDARLKLNNAETMFVLGTLRDLFARENALINCMRFRLALVRPRMRDERAGFCWARINNASVSMKAWRVVGLVQSAYTAQAHPSHGCAVWRLWTRRPDKNRVIPITYTVKAPEVAISSSAICLCKTIQKKSNAANTLAVNCSLCTDFCFAHCTLSTSSTLASHMRECWTFFSAVCMRLETYEFVCDRFPCHWMHPISIRVHGFASLGSWFTSISEAARTGMCRNCCRFFVYPSSVCSHSSLRHIAHTILYSASINHCAVYTRQVLVAGATQRSASHESVTNDTHTRRCPQSQSKSSRKISKTSSHFMAERTEPCLCFITFNDVSVVANVCVMIHEAQSQTEDKLRLISHREETSNDT